MKKKKHVISRVLPGSIGEELELEPAEKLAEIFREKGCPTAEACEDVEEAFKKALAAKGEDGMLFCVGSLYLVGEIKTLILQGVGK